MGVLRKHRAKENLDAKEFYKSVKNREILSPLFILFPEMAVEGSFLRGKAKELTVLSFKLLTVQIPDNLCTVGMTT